MRPYHAAFFDGKLYAISHSNKLFALDIYSSEQGEPRIQSMRCVADSINDSGTASRAFPDGYVDHTYWRYLVESGGRLLQIRRLARIPSIALGCDRVRRCRTVSFDLFEADLTGSCGQWRPVSTLGGQAIFVGTYSRVRKTVSTSCVTRVVDVVMKILFTIVVCST